MNLGALVKTEKGEGFLVGQSTKAGGSPRYDVRLAECGTLCHAYDNDDKQFPVIREVELIDDYPIDHPKISKGMREFLLKRPWQAPKPVEVKAAA